MKRFTFLWMAGVVLVGLILAGLSADAQQVGVGDPSLEVNGSPVLTAASAGGVSGTIVSGSATAPNAGSPVLIYTTPSTGNFVLTQVCVTELQANQVQPLVGSILGNIALGGPGCTTYTPGLALGQNESLSYQDGSNDCCDTVVTITGVLQP